MSRTILRLVERHKELQVEVCASARSINAVLEAIPCATTLLGLCTLPGCIWQHRLKREGVHRAVPLMVLQPFLLACVLRLPWTG